MKGSDAVAQILKQEGVEYLFSYPVNNLIEAAAAIDIRPIVARTEKTLLNMTDGYTRATNGRRLGVCCVQAGPGIENAFGGVAQAFADSIPILLLPGGSDQRSLGAGGFDPLPSYQHVTKWAARVNAPERIPELLRRAFTLLRSGRPGPVLLELPADVTGTDVDDATANYTPARAYRSAGDPADVAEAARLLLAAQRPLLHVGHGVLWAEAWDELREVAELLDAPVMTTMSAKGAFPEDHPLSAGTGASTITRSAAYGLRHADVVFGIGCSFAKGGFSAPIPPGKTIVHATNDPADVDKYYPAQLAIVGDAKLVLRQVIEEVRRQQRAGAPAPRADREAYLAQMRAAGEAGRQEWQPRLTSDEVPINPYRVIWELMQAVDSRETILTHDSGNPRDQLLTNYQALTPRGYIGWGKSTQLGTGLGIALGAKLAHPEKLCVNVMGDLAFGTAGMEVETAVRERLPILTIILNNSRMGGYTAYLPIAAERYHTNRLTGRYAEVAGGLGAYAERVEQPGEVGAAIRRGVGATREGRPAVLEMITKEEPVYPRARAVLDSIVQ